MKTLLAIALLPVGLIAQEIGTSVEVKNIGSSRVSDYSWKTSYGSYNREVTTVRRYEVRMRTKKTANPITMVAAFVGKEMDVSKKDVYLSQVFKEKVTLDARTEFSKTVEAVDSFNDDNYEALGERERAGLKLYGYIIYFYEERDKKQVLIGIAASSEELKKKGLNPTVRELIEKEEGTTPL
jgi:hypothetical protein